MVVIGITPKQGDIYQPQVLEKVKRITEEVDNAPGVVRSTMMSLAASGERYRGECRRVRCQETIAE